MGSKVKSRDHPDSRAILYEEALYRCACVCVCTCVRACVCACVSACVRETLLLTFSVYNVFLCE